MMAFAARARRSPFFSARSSCVTRTFTSANSAATKNAFSARQRTDAISAYTTCYEGQRHAAPIAVATSSAALRVRARRARSAAQDDDAVGAEHDRAHEGQIVTGCAATLTTVG